MPWRSLSEVYTERVINRRLSEATVNIKFKDSNEDHTFELEDVYARKVLGFTAYTSHFLNDLLIEWMESGDWSSVAVRRGSEQINSILNEVFDMSSPDIISKVAEDIKKILLFKENNRTFYNFVTNRGSDIYEVFNIPGLSVLNDPKFISKLCQIDFAEGKVSVGPGEVAITLFSEAKNPKKGDLHVTGLGEIGLKGTDGRIGKGEREVSIYNRIINKATDARSLEQIQNNLFDKIREIKTNFPDHKLLLKFNGINIQRKLYKVIQSIYDSKDLKDFFIRTESKDFTKAESEKLISTISSLASKEIPNAAAFKEELKNIINIAYKIYGYKQGKETRQFRMYFELDIVDDETKLATILEYIEPKNINNDVKGLIANNMSAISAEQIVGAISAANYQQKEGFSYIIFANTTTSVIGGGSFPCKIIGPFTNKYEDNLAMLISNIGDIVVTPNADRGGFQTQYRGSIEPTAMANQVANIGTPTSESEGEAINIPI